MTDQTPEAREAADNGEKPDLGRTPDHLADALTGSDQGSDTRAGSLRGGSASGSDSQADQDAINATLASEGMEEGGFRGPAGDPAEGKTTVNDRAARQPGDDADAATG
jgi:hypothetical protein